jgi:hypothetical protein
MLAALAVAVIVAIGMQEPWIAAGALHGLYAHPDRPPLSLIRYVLLQETRSTKNADFIGTGACTAMSHGITRGHRRSREDAVSTKLMETVQ